jgi:hypothetical protein
MPNLTSVNLTNGVPDGNGTVSTLDALLAALAAKITVLLDASTVTALSGAVALDAPTLAALTGDQATLDAPTIAALNVARALDAPTIAALTTAAIPAGANNIGTVGIAPATVTLAAAVDTSFVANGAANVKLTPKFKSIAVAASGTVIPAVAGKMLRVLALKLMANGAVNAKWQSHVGPTDLTGLSYYTNPGDGEVLPFNPLGWFQTIAGEALDINLSAAVAVGGHLTYVEV